MQRLAKVPFKQRSNAIARACTKAGIELDGSFRVSQKAKAQQSAPSQTAPSQPPSRRARPTRQTADTGNREPLRLQQEHWSQPIMKVEDITRETVGAVAIATQSAAKEAAVRLKGCGGAIALITNRPIPDTEPEVQWEASVPNRVFPGEEIRVHFLGNGNSLLTFPRVLTQLGSGKVKMVGDAAPPLDAPPPSAETTHPMLFQLSEEDLPSGIVKEIVASGEPALFRTVETYIKQYSVTEGDGKPPPQVQEIFRSEKMRKQNYVSPSGKRRWSVIAKVKPKVVDLLMNHSMLGGIECCSANRDLDKRRLVVVPIPKEFDAAAARAKIAAGQWPHCTHGVIRVQRGLYARGRTDALDALRREVAGAAAAE
eukprot:gene32469-5645_t